MIQAPSALIGDRGEYLFSVEDGDVSEARIAARQFISSLPWQDLRQGVVSAEGAVSSIAGLELVPNVSFVEFNTVPSEQHSIFLLKGLGSIMFLLRIKVFDHGSELTRTNG